MQTQKLSKAGLRLIRMLVLPLLTPLLEKNPRKLRVSRCHVPVVLSMARVVVLVFAAAMLRQIWLAGVAAWPDATLSIAVVLAIPLLSALESLKPTHTVALMKALLQQVGTGGTRAMGRVFDREPSPFDDHTADGVIELKPRRPRSRRRHLKAA